MKLHFAPDLDYKHTAIQAVCDLFRGVRLQVPLGVGARHSHHLTAEDKRQRAGRSFRSP